VDILAELGGGRLIAIEAKADPAPTTASARHLPTMRDSVRQGFHRRHRPAHRASYVSTLGPHHRGADINPLGVNRGVE